MDKAVFAAARLSGRMAFFAAGFALSAWAPLVPYAKANLNADEGTMGLLLLCMGFGGALTMPLAGWAVSRIGAKPLIIAGGLGMAMTLPLLGVLTSPVLFAAGLFLFGASLGLIDVSMNIHEVTIERATGIDKMSGLHAMFSVGSIAGSGAMAGVLALGINPMAAALAGGAVTFFATLAASPRLMAGRVEQRPGMAWPRGIVILLALLAALAFLAEGAVLDWSAILISGRGLLSQSTSGTGYFLFAIAMTAARLGGDRIVRRFGAVRVLQMGSLIACAGFVALLASPWVWLAMAGFALLGAGLGNTIPIMFGLAGRQKVMDSGIAVATITTIGYSGIMIGPGLIGLVAKETSLVTAFWLLAGLMLALATFARMASRV
ncbi:MAG: MFS transporter [Paracoccaceae bacterium]